MSWVYRRPPQAQFRQRRRTLPAPPTATDQTLTGVKFSKPPTFTSGAMHLPAELQVSALVINITYNVSVGDQTLDGVLFSKSPTFISGTVSATYTVTGVTPLTKGPSFIAGTVSSDYQIVGNLFARPPTWITGSVTSAYDITGVVFTSAPVFVPGTVSANYTLSGVLFSTGPSFISGSFTLTYTVNGQVFRPNKVYLYPDSDNLNVQASDANGGDNDGDLFDELQPPTNSADDLWVEISTDDTDLPTSAIGAVEVGLTNPSGTVGYGGHHLSIRTDSKFDFIGGNDGVFALYEGVTLKSQVTLDTSAGEWTQTDHPAPGATLIPTISNYNNLYLRITVTQGDAGSLVSKVSYMGLAVPDQIFISGAVNPGGVQIDGVSPLSKPPTFISGTVTPTYDLEGVLFSAPPTFISGDIYLDQTISGVLFSKPPSFISGLVSSDYTLAGVLFSAPPSFISGVVFEDKTISGVLFEKPPLFGARVTIYGRPNGDDTINGVWSRSPSTPSTYYDKIDEATPSTTDYIYTSLLQQQGRYVRFNTTVDDLPDRVAGTDVYVRTYWRWTSTAGTPNTFVGIRDALGASNSENQGRSTSWATRTTTIPASWVDDGARDWSEVIIYTSVYAGTTGSKTFYLAWMELEYEAVEVGTVTATYQIDGQLFSAPPSFIAGTVTSDTTLVGSTFAKGPSFPTGSVTQGYTLQGVLFSKPPAFISGTIQVGGVAVDGVLFERPPSFLAGTITATYALSGVTFNAPPSFISGEVIPVQTVSGVLFSKPPSFISGTVSSAYTLAGVTFTAPPSFIPGAVIREQFLNGVLFSKSPTFISGVITSGGITIQGVLFSAPPTFISGTVLAGGVTLDGTLFSAGPSFPQGQISAAYTLAGSLLSKPPGFISGVVTYTYTLTGVLFSSGPTFIPGTVSTNFTVTGVLFSAGPSFISGTVTYTYTLTGQLFSAPPAFPTGIISTGLQVSGNLFQKPPHFPTGDGDRWRRHSRRQPLLEATNVHCWKHRPDDSRRHLLCWPNIHLRNHIGHSHDHGGPVCSSSDIPCWCGRFRHSTPGNHVCCAIDLHCGSDHHYLLPYWGHLQCWSQLHHWCCHP